MRTSLKLGLALTVGATAWVATLSEDSPPPNASAVSRPDQSGLTKAKDVASSAPLPTRLAREAPLAWAKPPQPGKSGWEPPPPPPAPPPAAPPPAPPPRPPDFPFQVIGSYEEQGRVLVLLAGSRSTLAVKAGDTLDGGWRVQSVDGQNIVLLHAPTQQPRTLPYRTP